MTYIPKGLELSQSSDWIMYGGGLEGNKWHLLSNSLSAAIQFYKLSEDGKS